MTSRKRIKMHRLHFLRQRRAAIQVDTHPCTEIMISGARTSGIDNINIESQVVARCLIDAQESAALLQSMLGVVKQRDKDRQLALPF